MAVGIKDIAKVAGVSKATVSLALNNSDLVNADTKALILDIAKKLDYIPDSAARSLAKSKSSTIGIIVPNIQNEYYGKLVYYLEGALQREGYFALWALSNEDPELEAKAIRAFISKNVEGIILLPINKKAASYKHLLLSESHDIPLVQASSHYQDVPFDCVMSNLEQASYELTLHILNTGRKKIRFFCSQLDNIPAKMRIRGIEKAHREHGLVFSEENTVIFKEIDYESAFSYVMMCGETIKEADAIIAMNDMMALGTINALQELGVGVPKDIAVAGYDDTTYSRVSPVSITTIDQNLQKISAEAVRVLMQKIQEPLDRADAEKNVTILLEPKLVVRDST